MKEITRCKRLATLHKESLSPRWVARWLLPRRHPIPVPFPILPLFSRSPLSLHNSLYLTLSRARTSALQMHDRKRETQRVRKNRAGKGRWKQVHAQYMRAASRVPFAPIHESDSLSRREDVLRNAISPPCVHSSF